MMKQAPVTGRVVMLAAAGESTNIIYHALAAEFDVARVVLEAPVSKLDFIRRRQRKLGTRTVVGQLIFRALVVPYLAHTSHTRREQIKRTLGLNDAPIDKRNILRVPSVNSDEALKAIQCAKPDAIIINGTRIVAARVLDSTSAPFINMHAGITPLYRGVHGAYWALVESNLQACGVTVHLVDTGIDTGGILGQSVIAPTPADNFMSYPLLQTATGLPLLKQAVRDALARKLEIKAPPAGVSKLWSHPTVWEYMRHRVRRRVK
jgi:folate-dependent phosphoribosylglycinamide formyltransferase PurN